MSTTEAALNTILGDPRFWELKRQLHTRTMFDILGISTRELSHAALVAWLLDPNESHNLGVGPLRAFLQRAASLPESIAAGWTPLAVSKLDLRQLRSIVEHPFQRAHTPGAKKDRRIDILVYAPDTSSRPPLRDPAVPGAPILLIEYKVNAAETDAQTIDYCAWADANPTPTGDGGHRAPLLVYAAPDGERPQAGRFCTFGYSALADWLVNIDLTRASPRGRFLIQEFTQWLNAWNQESTASSGIAHALRTELHDSLSLLDATARAAHPQAFELHAAVWNALDVSFGRGTLPSSTFIQVFRRVAGERLGSDTHPWKLSNGKKSFSAHRTIQIRGLPNGYLQLWMERPKNGKVRLAVDVWPPGWGKSGAAPHQPTAWAERIRPSEVASGTISQTGRRIWSITVTLPDDFDDTTTIARDERALTEASHDMLTAALTMISGAAAQA